jgi:FMN phosphatase YigB (HAD superfamily)
VTREHLETTGGSRRCLLFDLGNVLITFDHRVVSRLLAPHAPRQRPVPAQAIHDYIFGDSGPDSPNARIDRGAQSLAALYGDVAARFSLTLSLDEFRHAWSSIFAADLNHAVADRLTRFAASGVDVRICSNTNDAHWAGLQSAHPLLASLDRDGRCLLSFRIGKVKTDPGFFAHVTEKTGLPAGRHLLIDDREDNCQAAEAAGMSALQFAAPDADAGDRLDALLRSRGWLQGYTPGLS